MTLYHQHWKYCGLLYRLLYKKFSNVNCNVYDKGDIFKIETLNNNDETRSVNVNICIIR